MKNIFQNLAYLLFGYKKQERLKLKDIKKGQFIRIEWNMVEGKIAALKCLNNDTSSKKLLLEVEWDNYVTRGIKQYEQIVISYNDEKLKNYHLLNSSLNFGTDEDSDTDNLDIVSLQKKLNEYLEKENYEEADKLQKKIDKLSKK